MHYFVRVQGDWSICPCQSKVYTAISNCADGTISYKWEKSTDGVNFQTIYHSTGNNTFDLYSGCGNTSNFVIRVTATDGFTSSVSTKNVSHSTYNCNSSWSHATKPSNNVEDADRYHEPIKRHSHDMRLYPNPVRNSESVVVKLPAEFTGHVSVVNLNATVLLTRAVSPDHPKTNFKIMLSQLRSGIYFVQATNTNTGKTHLRKLIVK